MICTSKPIKYTSYNTFHTNFEGTHNLIYSDTDSLVYSIQHEDIYEWFKYNKDHFDLSELFFKLTKRVNLFAFFSGNASEARKFSTQGQGELLDPKDHARAAFGGRRGASRA